GPPQSPGPGLLALLERAPAARRGATGTATAALLARPQSPRARQRRGTGAVPRVQPQAYPNSSRDTTAAAEEKPAARIGPEFPAQRASFESPDHRRYRRSCAWFQSIVSGNA